MQVFFMSRAVLLLLHIVASHTYTICLIFGRANLEAVKISLDFAIRTKDTMKTYR